MSKLPSSVNDFKRSSPEANLLIDEKPFSHIYTEPTFSVAFYTSRNLDTCSVFPSFLTFWTCLLKAGWKGKGKASSDLTLRRSFHRLRAYHAVWKLTCPVKQKFGRYSNVRLCSIGKNILGVRLCSIEFGNRTSGVRLGSITELFN